MDSITQTIGIIQIIFIVADILLAAGLVYAILKALEYRPDLSITRKRKGVVTIEKAEVLEQWAAICEKIEQQNISMARLAIIDADKLIDSILKKAQIGGEHMADRLDRISAEDYPSIQAVWRAHRLRNELVHSPAFEISIADAQRAINNYEAFLKEIGIL